MSEALVCYGIIGDDEMNKAYKIDSREFEDWKKRYKNDFFEGTYLSMKDEPLDVQRYYFDPDSAYKKGTNNQFFSDLTIFLNKSENKWEKELKGKFKYSLALDKGIKVSGTDREGKKITPFYLRSDQLGFSAPSNQKSHPYDLYISKCHDKVKAVEQVVDWISMSRTIGGSFLWPRPFYDNYNPSRGGKITSSRRYYIQDRVDLTLWEIKNYYCGNGEKDILYRYKEENLKIWLDHFGSFETYIRFFSFDYFMDEGTSKPKSIMTQKATSPVRGENGENPEPEIIERMKFELLERALSTVSDNIKKRSLAMTKMIYND